jgi:hypothetical protein
MIVKAFQQGAAAARAGEPAGGPYMASHEPEKFEAWRLGYAEEDVRYRVVK